VRVLFDQGAAVPLRVSLPQPEVSTAYERGWSKLKNGELLDAAEREGLECLSRPTQASAINRISALDIGIVCLLSTSWPRIQRVVGTVVSAINAASPGSYTEVEIP
jgi:hypothetical protein